MHAQFRDLLLSEIKKHKQNDNKMHTYLPILGPVYIWHSWEAPNQHPAIVFSIPKPFFFLFFSSKMTFFFIFWHQTRTILKTPFFFIFLFWVIFWVISGHSADEFRARQKHDDKTLFCRIDNSTPIIDPIL